MRAHLAELGLVAQKGREGVQQLMRTVADADDEQLPSDARVACQAIIAQLQAVQMQITGLEKRIHQAHRANPASRRLDAIPGFGVIVSSAVAATMTDPRPLRRAASSPPGSDGSRDRTPPAASNGSAPSQATATCDPCISLGAQHD